MIIFNCIIWKIIYSFHHIQGIWHSEKKIKTFQAQLAKPLVSENHSIILFPKID